MPRSHSVPASQSVAKIVTRSELHNCETWQRAFRNKCKDRRYYEIVEETVEGGFEYRYLLFEDGFGKTRAIQPVFFVRQNLIEGVPGKISSIVDRVRKVLPRFLTMRVLMVGCAAGTGDLSVVRRDRRIVGGKRVAREPFDLCETK